MTRRGKCAFAVFFDLPDPNNFLLHQDKKLQSWRHLHLCSSAILLRLLIFILQTNLKSKTSLKQIGN